MAYPVDLLAVGRRSPLWEPLVESYARRLRGSVELELRWLKPGSAAEPTARLREEARRIEAAIPPGRYRIVLDRRGEAVDSLELARRFARWKLELSRGVSLVLGSDLGLDPAVLAGADWRWSLGPLTWPHQLARLMVVEQLFRAASLEAGIQYHRPSF